MGKADAYTASDLVIDSNLAMKDAVIVYNRFPAWEGVNFVMRDMDENEENNNGSLFTYGKKKDGTWFIYCSECALFQWWSAALIEGLESEEQVLGVIERHIAYIPAHNGGGCHAEGSYFTRDKKAA